MSVHRLLTLQLPAPLAQTIGPPANQQQRYNTRGADRLLVPRIHTEAGRRRLCYSGVIAYNNVLEAQGAISKGAIKKYLADSRLNCMCVKLMYFVAL